VIVSPVVATTPLFSPVILIIFLRGKESVTSRTILGTVAVVAGTIVIVLEGSGVKSS
jgi:drug/metabolite transporter (DMT)-like permease